MKKAFMRILIQIEKKCLWVLLLFIAVGVQSQDTELDELSQKLEKGGMGKIYVIDSIAVEGTDLITPNLIINFSGLKVGDKILLPGSDNISRAIKSLYDKKIFFDIQIFSSKIEGNKMSLLIRVKDRPRLSFYKLKGISKSQQRDLSSKLKLSANRPITQSMIDAAILEIKNFFKEKGYNFTKVNITTSNSKSKKGADLMSIIFDITTGRKMHIYEVNFWGNNQVSPHSLIKRMQKTKPTTRLTLFPLDAFNPSYGRKTRIKFKDYITHWGFLSYTKTVKFLDPYIRLNIFSSSKFKKEQYETDKNALLDYYNEIGYRDAYIVRDSVYSITDRLLDIDIEVKEGNKYYFGDITWVGNYKFSDKALDAILNIKKGDSYNQLKMEKKLGLGGQSPEGGIDIMSLYMDNGHLFFRVQPIEKRIYNDTIDFEMRIIEGPIATINEINIVGNTVTNERVIRRALRILPGDKFNRSALIRSVREIGTLGFFNPETINPVPKPNVENGTVDILLNVEEKSNDQIEASISYGGQIGVTGRVAFTLKNFSLRRLFNRDKSKSRSFIPRGDAQTFSISLQLNGPQYMALSTSFTEPWIGSGYRRTSLSVGMNYTNYSPGAFGTFATVNNRFSTTGNIQTLGASINLGSQLRWPDDYFIFKYGINYTRYLLNNYTLFTGTVSGDGSSFSNGVSDNISLRLGLSRSSIDNPIFPKSGSNFSILASLTPPYSLFDKNLEQGTVASQLRLTEYFKLSYEAEWYLPLSAAHGPDKNKQLVLKILTRGSYLGRYNDNMTYTPFERFQVGDVGLVANGGFLGFDVIGHRGYFVYDDSDPSINPEQTSTSSFFTLYNKYLFELRYPLTFSNSATIFVTSYLEMANGWYRLEEYDPFQLRKSVGVGVRFYLPIFGLLGFDYAIGLDRLNNESNSIFDAGKFSFILGFEPK